MKTTSTLGVYAVQHLEGFKLKPYKDDKAGTPQIEYSIGYGHQILPGEEWMMNGITQEQATDLLKKDLAKSEAVVNKQITRSLNQDQFDSLVSFTYNTGGGGLTHTGLQSAINNYANEDTVRAEFGKWIHSGGKVNSKLVKRREKEANLFFSKKKELPS